MTGITFVGTGVTLESRPGETLTETMYRAGYAMRIACRGGGCGICRVHIDSGEYQYEALVADSVLPQEERDRGIALACRAVPTTDIVVTVPEDGKLRCIAPVLVQFARRKSPAGTGEGRGT